MEKQVFAVERSIREDVSYDTEQLEIIDLQTQISQIEREIQEESLNLKNVAKRIRSVNIEDNLQDQIHLKQRRY